MFAMFGLGAGEIVLIALVILLLFGATRIPSVLGGLGRGIREFKKGLSGTDEAPKGPAEPARSPALVEELRSRVGKQVRLLPDGTLEVGGANGATMVEVDASGVVIQEPQGVNRIPLQAVKRVIQVS